MRKWLVIVFVVPFVVLSAQNPADDEADRYHASKNDHYMQNFYFPPSPGTTPWWPAWAPDGKSIAVAMQGSIWRVDPSTGAATELVTSRKYLSSPVFSPDGKWLLYTADDDGKDVQLE